MLDFLKLSTCLLSLRTGCVVIALLVTLCTSEIQELNRASSENAKNDFCTLPPPSPPKKKENSDIFRVPANNAKQGVLTFHLIEL